MHADYPAFNERLEAIFRRLNLKSHMVGRTRLAACGDIEGHWGAVHIILLIYLFIYLFIYVFIYLFICCFYLYLFVQVLISLFIFTTLGWPIVFSRFRARVSSREFQVCRKSVPC